MDIICSKKKTDFQERSSRKTVSFEEQIMSKDKYPSIYSPQMEIIVFITLQIFFTTPGRAVLKIWQYSQVLPSLIIYMKKLLDSDWLRAVQFKCNTSAKSVTPVQITPHNSDYD